MKKRVTFILDSEVYKKFHKFCEDNDLILSKRVERLLKMQTENEELVNKEARR